MKKIYVLFVLCFCLFLYAVNPVYCQNTGESKTNQIDIPYESEADLIEIMFDENSQVRLRNGSLVDLKTDALNGLSPILEQLDWHNWFRICDIDEETIDRWSINGERNTGNPVYNMNNIYRLQIPKGHNIWEISTALEELPGVLLARPVPKPMEPPVPPSYQSNQGYLNPASSTPTGIDAAYAWTQTGGTGAGVTVCDLEYSWNYNHADITKAIGSQINPNPISDPYSNNNHGTAVIGELVADNNGWGTTGICYGANLKTCGTFWSGSWNVPGAISYAIANLSAGDVILIEQQWEYTIGSGNFIPIEWWLNYSPGSQTFNGVYAAIINAISNGIHVVEAGGNGGINTDGLTWYGNSGAIIVGAGGAYAGGTYPNGDLQKLSFSSYGSRFDLQGWGEDVVTTGYSDLYSAEGVNYWYTNTFSGTSSASPIVAGALACAEGYWLANVSGTPPTPAYMRSHLKTYGTAQIIPPSGNIGPRPDLYATIINFPPPVQNFDWGDAPDLPYPTLSTNYGANHLINQMVFMGNFIDAEANGQPNLSASGDDNTGFPDDEDGVTFNNVLRPGSTANITVVASVPGYLNAWVDFNGINIWSDPGEQIFTDAFLFPGPNNLTFFVPASALVGNTYARFRFSTQQGIVFLGFAPDGEVEDYWVFIDEPIEQLDWGDAPDPMYPTLMASNGANHLIDGITYLGNQVDGEPDGQPEPMAMGDDMDIIYPPPNDDEDGVNFLTPFMQNQTANIDVIASVPGILNAWLDFAKDGSWAEPGDQIFIDTPLNPGINNLNIWVPSSAMAGQTFIRFRFSTLPGLNFLGQAPDGEVEDYEVYIEQEQIDEFDFGDAPEGALAYPSLGISGSFPTCVNVAIAGWIEHKTMDLYFGPAFDLENEGNAGLCPAFNPNQYNMDECFNDGDAGLIIPDGFTIIGPVGSETVQPCSGANNQHLGYTCQNAVWGIDIDIDVHNHMPSGNQGFLNVFIDWNQDGQWSGSSNCPGYAVPEHVLIDFPISNPFDGPVSGLMAAGTTLPIGPNAGYVWARFTLTDLPAGSDWDGTGSFEDGETEDYLLLILEQEDQIDFGDASDPSYPTLLTSNGANHTIDGVTYLGASVDGETDGQPDPQALGDDNDGNDDEDGVTFDWPLEVGNPCKITVNASAANGLFSGWIDFNGNGSWADSGEQVFADVALDAGNNALYFTVPFGTTVGLTTYGRFRYSNQPNLSYVGPAFDGEVEDYEVNIVEIEDYKWAQYPDMTLPGLHAHDYVIASYQSIVLTDDWLCNGGLVTDMHWWGNYELDALNQEKRGGGIDHFHISIHADDPTGTCLPVGSEIVGFNVPFIALEQTTALVNIEGCTVYLYEFILPQPFVQEAGKRYWVDVTAFSSDPADPAYWRWQESMRSYYPILCPASDKLDPAPGTWSWIQWGANPPYKYSDMAFIITSQDLEPMDYGDANDPNYPTYLVNDGARHFIDGLTFMGTSVDAEYNGQADPNALGDDNDGNDDEDGVTFTTSLIQDQNANVDIIVSVDGYLNAWVDFNANGSWGDPGEQIATDVLVLTGTYTLTFNVPLTATIGATYSRFRFSTATGLSYTGQAPDGEVEDHEVTINEVPNKWAQYPDITLPGLHAHDYDSPPYAQIILADDWICEGGWVTDFHWWGNYELDVFNQEIRGSGIDHFHLSIHSNDPTNCLPQDPEIWGADVPLSSLTEHNTGLVNIEGCTIYLYEYILDEPFPQIQGVHYWLDITAFCIDPANPAYWRWQEALRDTTLIACAAAEKVLPGPGTWDKISWPQEKYSQMAFVVTSGPAPDIDMGDAADPTYPTLLANNGAAHIIDGVTFLGTSVDSETDGQPDPFALGDDNDGNDDEDGVSINPIFPIVPGSTIWYDIVASTSGILNCWIDWDANGSWGDTGEHAGVDIGLSPGNNTLLIPIPANAIVGHTYTRFRFSTEDSLSYTGIAPNGEVEDHELTIEGDLDFGDAPDQAFPAYPTLLKNNGARHVIDPTIFLGNSIDPEPDGQPDMPSTGDDNDGNDDEDGVLIPAVLSHGSMNTITVIASVDGYLNGWIDFNSSGNWVEADEYILMDQSITAGPNTLNIWIPPTSVKGTTYARFRFCTLPGYTTFIGQAPDGEVEDYQVEIGEPEKWLQNPDLSDLGLDVDATFSLDSPDPPMILADDFLCTTTGSITRIEIWGSWLNDYIPFFEDPGAVVFTLSIHEDIPADQNPLGFSMPGDVIWWKTYDPIEFMFEPAALGLIEGWYNPLTGYYEPIGDTQCWKYIFNLDDGEFIQQGTPDEPKVYWLDVQAQPLDPAPFCRFGWKTSQDHWNDDAVWAIGGEPYIGPWNELIYPPTHPLAGQSIDLAFAIYGLENPYILVDLTALLEGPFDGSEMQTTLNSSNLVALNQPYASDPSAIWYYAGTEAVASIPNPDVVDWVMIELRDATTAANATGATIVNEKAAFIKGDGKIVATDGESLMKFYVSFVNNPYAVVWHRNHLGILTANPLNLVGLGLYRYDFTTGLGQAYLNGQKDLGGGIFGMMGGDGQPDGTVDINDVINIWAPAAGTTGYKLGDYNMDTQIDNKDKNDIWFPNNSSGTQVPN